MRETANRVEVKPIDDGNTLEISVKGVLGLDLYRDFRAAYAHQLERYSSYNVNLKDCEHIDSSGLGVLLILRDYTGLTRDELALTQCSPSLRKLLSFANFEQLFTITSAAEAAHRESSANDAD